MQRDLLRKLRRREFLKLSAVAAASSTVPGRAIMKAWGVSTAEGTAPTIGKPGQNPIQNVCPIIGTGWRGHMFPGAVAPFGLVQLSPDTSGPPEPKWNARGDWYGWDHCSGYHYPDNVVVGFSHTHVQGTGGVDLGDILVMPIVEGRNWFWDPGLPNSQRRCRLMRSD